MGENMLKIYFLFLADVGFVKFVFLKMRPRVFQKEIKVFVRNVTHYTQVKFRVNVSSRNYIWDLCEGVSPMGGKRCTYSSVGS